MRSSSIFSSPGLLIVAAALANAYTVTDVTTFMYKNIDPIVFPGSYSKSHLHIFFGSDAVKATTATSAELRTGCTTASNPNDFSTYWTPALLHTGKNGSEPVPIAPERFSAYYENEQFADAPLPENLQLLAGNAMATKQADVPDEANISWYCEGDPPEAGKDAAAFPTKTCSTHLQHLVFFPDCVFATGSKFTTTKYSSGSYKTKNSCPTGMVRIPRIKFSVRYDVRGVITDGWNGPPPLTLACGSSYCAHGDAFNGWDTQALTNMLKAGGNSFAEVAGSKGSADVKPTCKAKDAEPTQGTSDYNDSVKLMGGKRSVPFSG